MKDETRQALAAILTAHGAHIAGDPRLCHAFLRDYRPWDDLEITLLVNSVKINIPATLRQTSPTDLPQVNQRLAQSLKTQHGHDLTQALWAVETWAIALQVMQPSQARAGKTAPARPQPPKKQPPGKTPAQQPNDPPPNWLPKSPPSSAAPPTATPPAPTDLWGQTGYGGQSTASAVGPTPLQMLFSFEGRMSPTRFLWIAIPAGVGVPLLCFLILAAIHILFAAPLATLCAALPMAILMLPATWIFLAVSAKRWHDMNISGWRAVLIFTPPIVGHLFTLLIGGLIQGTLGPNQYGDPPVD